jgi:hypothetical protein
MIQRLLIELSIIWDIYCILIGRSILNVYNM